MLRLTLLLQLLLLLPSAAMADGQQRLESHFKNKVFVIRGFYRDNKLSYDAQGRVQGQPHVGPWALALFRIEKVQAQDHELLLQGTRAAARFDQDKMKFVNLFLGKHERIKMKIQTPDKSLSASALDALQHQLFITNLDAETAPEWWHDFFAGKDAASHDSAPGTQVPGLYSDGQPVFRPGGKANIQAPRILQHFEPEYDELARSLGLQGSSVVSSVVNKAGVPEHIQIVKPFGMGFDDSAVEAIKGWRFTAATMNGQPVPVLTSAEVRLQLY